MSFLVRIGEKYTRLTVFSFPETPRQFSTRDWYCFKKSPVLNVELEKKAWNPLTAPGPFRLSAIGSMDFRSKLLKRPAMNNSTYCLCVTLIYSDSNSPRYLSSNAFILASVNSLSSTAFTIVSSV